jgi:hypothetical protein
MRQVYACEHLARKHPINISARKKYLAKLIEDYRPMTTTLTQTCSHLSAIYERLDAVRGSPDR